MPSQLEPGLEERFGELLVQLRAGRIEPSDQLRERVHLLEPAPKRPRFRRRTLALAFAPALLVAAVVVGVLVIPWGVWQIGVAAERTPEATFRTVPSAHIGAAMRSFSDGRPCFFLSRGMYPELSIASRCQGTRYRLRVPTLRALERFARDGGRDVFVVAGGSLRPGEDELRALVSPNPVPGKPHWRLYHFRPETFSAPGT
jgi:hypothetical protein